MNLGDIKPVKNSGMDVDFIIPPKFFEELHKEEDKKKQLKSRQELFSTIKCFSKKKESLFIRLVDSLFGWIPYPITPEKMYISERVHSLGVQYKFKHPEFCIIGKIPTKLGLELMEEVVKSIPIETEKKIDFEFGHSDVNKKNIQLVFHKMDSDKIKEWMPENSDFYKFYLDSEPFEVLYSFIPESFLQKYDPKAMDEEVKKKKYMEYQKNKICWFCKEEKLNLKTCSRCGKARYCSRDCQLKDWKIHKKNCKK